MSVKTNIPKQSRHLHLDLQLIIIIWDYQLIRILKVAHFEHGKKKLALAKTPPR